MQKFYIKCGEKIMKPKTIEIKKLWHNSKISIRGYLVRQAIKDKQPILVKHNNQKMFLSVEALERGKILTRNIRSKFPPYKTYDLIDYEWKPEEYKSNDLFYGFENTFSEVFEK